jgi:hypothetical protein
MHAVRAPKDGWPADAFAEAVAQSTSVAGVLRYFGVTVSGWNYRRVHLQVARERLDTTHWLGQGHRRGASIPVKEGAPLETILVEHSTYSNTFHLKRRLLRVCPNCHSQTATYWGRNRGVGRHIAGLGSEAGRWPTA